MDKKPRGDSKLDYLPGNGTGDLRDGLLSGRFPTYDTALEWLAAEHGVSSSSAALSDFYRRVCKPVIKQRRSIAALKAEAWGEAMDEDGSLDAGLVERVKQIVFEVIDVDKPKPKDVKTLVESLVKLRGDKRADDQIDLDKRKVTLLEARDRRLGEMEAKAKDLREGGGLSPETLEVIEKQLKLL